MNVKQDSSSPRGGLGILVRTALLSWLVTTATLLAFIAVVVPSQKAAFLDNLRSKALGVSASLQDVAAGAAVSEDYSAIVDHCTKILSEDSSIDYIIFTRKDGFSLVHDRDGWRTEQRENEWNSLHREARGEIRRQEGAPAVYSHSRPFDYSGIEWGWIHVGLSLESYQQNVNNLYKQCGLAIVLCLGLGLLASMFYARRLTEPILRLRWAVQEVANGDLSVRASATLEILKEYVLSWKAIPETRPDAAAALQCLTEAARHGKPFQVVVIDWKMPSVDGVALGGLIREHPLVSETGLVLMSSFSLSDGEAETSSQLFSAALPKPVRKSELYDAIATAANGSYALLASRTVHAPTTTAPVLNTTRRVLLVEDNEINREVASEMLREIGLTCRIAVNGQEAVQAIEENRPDLVFMDCQMPVMDGYEATRRVRAWECASGSPRLPIIALTAHAMKGDREVCLAAGMDDFLTKPLDPREMGAMIRKWLSEGASPAPLEEGIAFPEQTGGAEPGPAIDFEDLLQRVMGKQPLAERLLRMFADCVPEYFSELEVAILQDDPEEVKAKAHRLKGAAANVSARKVGALAAELESIGGEGDLASAPNVVEKLREAIEVLRAEVADADVTGGLDDRACA